jgi:hypothetical protein
MSGTWRVVLGEHWQRFTCCAQPVLQMLGSVQRGAQIGALARRADGSYVQVNGDHQTPLGGFQIERALRLRHRRGATAVIHQQRRWRGETSTATSRLS